ncbi:hypothetical protein A2U01_0055092, partial [Trifolium medium]|nr:hypothetical protein [Trifolium medium]
MARRANPSCAKRNCLKLPFNYLIQLRDAPTRAARRATSRSVPCYYSMTGATRHA